MLVMLAAPLGAQATPPEVVARAYRDTREPVATRRGLDQATVERASKSGFVVRAERCRETECDRYAAPLAAAETARISVRDLNYGPGWLAIRVEDGQSVVEYYFAYARSGGLREVTRVLTNGPGYFRATVTWDPEANTLDVANEDPLPPGSGCPKPAIRHDVYRWKAPKLSVVSRDPVILPCH